jgi:1-deoxy-D-xylulose-5-phosphate synthase
MAIIEKIDKPSDMKLIKKELLPQLAKEIRDIMISTTASTGGHLAASLGTVELTIALHYVLDCPEDKILWDVGHQSYAHKIITGRRKQFSTLRQLNGISGFPNPSESEYDAFISGHSSTAISAALGYVCARDMAGKDNKVVAIVGDGSMTGGMAFEGLNNAGHLAKNIIVILNDNEMFISHRIGALSSRLAKLMTLGVVRNIETRIAKFLKRVTFFGTGLLRTARRLKVLLFPGMLFEELGFSYLGPIDGHDIFRLIEMLEKVKELKGPVLVHVVTKKGKGYEPAEKNPILYHGIGRFNVLTGEPEEDNGLPGYTEIFSKALVSLARDDEKIVCINDAMSEGTGLEAFRREYPKRFFDVGIAEQHAVTFAAGLAKGGYKPVCAIYSTFLQRAVDQLIHDVCLQKAPVVFVIDRAGLVGEDGPTHHGVFDMAFLRMIPNMVVMAPKDENELQNMLKTAIYAGVPCALRYPRGKAMGVKLDKTISELPIGKAEMLSEGRDVAILAVGNMVHPALLAARQLETFGIKATVVNMRFIKPLDEETIRKIIKYTNKVVTLEEGILSGGFGSAVSELISSSGVQVKSIGLPDVFVEHGNTSELRKKYGLTVESIVNTIKEFVK